MGTKYSLDLTREHSEMETSELPDCTLNSLLIDVEKAEVLCMPHSVIERLARVQFDAASWHRTVLRDLVTEKTHVLPDTDFSEFSVQDYELSKFITHFQVRGISTPYLKKPDTKFGIPFEGNISNPMWASINLGGSCNSKCIFCYTQWTRSVPDFHSAQIEKIIDRLSKITDLGTLVFTGGEASIRSDIVRLFKYAISVGFSVIHLQTNGRGLAKLELVEELAQAGLNTVLLSLHGPNSQIHDSITGVEGSFNEACNCLKNLAKSGVTTIVNCVICKSNQVHIAEIADFVSSLKPNVETLRFSYPIIEGAAFDNAEKVLVPISKIIPILRTAIMIAEGSGLRVELANMPLCICPQTPNVYDRVRLTEFIQVSPFYKYNIPRGEKSIKLASCSRCKKKTECAGIQIEYLRAFPEEISTFEPIV